MLLSSACTPPGLKPATAAKPPESFMMTGQNLRMRGVSSAVIPVRMPYSQLGTSRNSSPNMREDEQIMRRRLGGSGALVLDD